MCWAIIDASMVKEIVVSDPGFRKGSEVDLNKVRELLEASAHIKKESSIEDLAKAMDVDPCEFRKTLDSYNRYVADGLTKDPEFGKDLEGLRRIEEPPFFAIQFLPLARRTSGGPKQV